jgi:hypothetical protein
MSPKRRRSPWHLNDGRRGGLLADQLQQPIRIHRLCKVTVKSRACREGTILLQ